MAHVAVPSAIDTSGVAVITGGASGIGLELGQRLAAAGMAIAVLDFAAEEKLQLAARRLRQAGAPLAVVVRCEVGDAASCRQAQQRVAEAFGPERRVAALFNNAGTMGQASRAIIEGAADEWTDVFRVNVFGVVNTIKAFVPMLLEQGPLPSGKKTIVVTTSSVVGLLNHHIGPYSTSKMATTAVAEQFAIDLEALGEAGAHISPHSLHPTIVATGFFAANHGADFAPNLQQLGGTTAADVVDGLFRGLDAGKHYIIVDHETDVPTSEQLAKRFVDQQMGRRPRKPERLGMVLKMTDGEAFSRREAEMQRRAQSRL